jgi:hypothetical protein
MHGCTMLVLRALPVGRVGIGTVSEINLCAARVCSDLLSGDGCFATCIWLCSSNALRPTIAAAFARRTRLSIRLTDASPATSLMA